MKPPPPGPVSGLSATQDANAAAMQASTALPPSASTRAPASAVSWWPAAIAPHAAERKGRYPGRKLQARGYSADAGRGRPRFAGAHIAHGAPT